ncbi:MAG TPA: hypothetical protein DC042_12870 [Bacteroidales bacterium]|nr:hypothetical protein [Bacteroidales bacterium]
MKKLLLILGAMVISCPAFLSGQTDASRKKYERVSLTVIHINDPAPDPNYNGTTSQSVQAFFNQAKLVGPKYNDHTISTRDISIDLENFTAENRTMIGNPKEAGQILSFINQSDISRQIMTKWFDRKPDGTLSMDLIGQRGLYNANDNDYITANASQRQSAGLRDQGEKLLKISYILFVNYSDIQYKEGKTAGTGTYSGMARGYLYRLVWNDSISASLYENLWINEGDNESVRSAKKQKFDNTLFPVVHVRNVNTAVAQPLLTLTGDNKSDAEKRTALYNSLYENLMIELDNRVPEFQVRQTLISSKPIGATIGTKEGLYVDQRFFVFENVQKKNNELAKKRRAVIRAKRVIDNEKVTEGNTPPSTFYQVAGGKVDHFGMFMEQKNDKGIAVTGTVLSGEIAGPNLTLAYNLSRSLSKTMKIKTIPTGVNLFLDLGFESARYVNVSIPGYYLNENIGSYLFLRGSAGVSKDFYLLKNFHISPRIGYGVEYTNLYSKGEDPNFPEGLSAMGDHLLTGGSAGMNLLHNFQIVGGFNYYVPVGNLWMTAGAAEPAILGMRWSSVFSNRSGLSIFGGIKILL